MNSASVYVVVEGPSEQTFIREILAPKLGRSGVFLHPAVIGKPGHKGGDVRFARAKRDIELFLKQRNDTYVSTMFDFFRIGSDWPGLNTVQSSYSAKQKAKILEDATLNELTDLLPNLNVQNRFVPYLAMHEFEALLFSDGPVLAANLGVRQVKITSILKECKEPEEINDNPDKAPSKRILRLRPGYRKVAMGKTIAEEIGIDQMRSKCPHFDQWLARLQSLRKSAD